MEVPSDIYEDAMEQNHYRITRMMTRIQMHVNLGNNLKMNQWHFVKYNGIAYRIEGVLISTMRYNYMHMFPEGTYGCASCGKQNTMNHVDKCYVSAMHGLIICPTCSDPAFDHALVASLTHVTEKDIQMSSNTRCVTVFDQTMNEEELTILEHEDILNLEALTHNHNSEFIYVNNKTMGIIRTEFLARRVLRRWRAFLHRQLQSRLFKVLYHCAGLNMTTSVILSKTVV